RHAGPSPSAGMNPAPQKSTQRPADSQWRGTTAGETPVGPALCRPAEPGTTPARWTGTVGRDEPGTTEKHPATCGQPVEGNHTWRGTCGAGFMPASGAGLNTGTLNRHGRPG